MEGTKENIYNDFAKSLQNKAAIRFKKLMRHNPTIQNHNLIVEVHKAEMLGNGGWTTFDFVVLTASGSIVHITEATIDKILNK